MNSSWAAAQGAVRGAAVSSAPPGLGPLSTEQSEHTSSRGRPRCQPGARLPASPAFVPLTKANNHLPPARHHASCHQQSLSQSVSLVGDSRARADAAKQKRQPGEVLQRASRAPSVGVGWGGAGRAVETPLSLSQAMAATSRLASMAGRGLGEASPWWALYQCPQSSARWGDRLSMGSVGQAGQGHQVWNEIVSSPGVLASLPSRGQL